MARLRMFAGLRDIAGVGSTDIDGATVAEVLAEAGRRYGSAFERGLGNARVWVNGEEAEPFQPVSAEDEVALIPPVSGGSAMLERPAFGLFEVGVPLGLVALLVIANVLDDPAWWAPAVVAVVAVWVGDVVNTVSIRGTDLPVLPAMAAIVVAVVSVWLLGPPGLAVAAAGGVVLPLLWAVGSDSSRILAIISPVSVLSLQAALATGVLVLARSLFVQSTAVIGVFLVIAFSTVVVALLLEQFTHLPFGDPFTATAATAILASVVAAAVWGLDLVSFLIAGVVVAAALVAGRGFGSILRTRRVILVERSPGRTSLLDGIVLAAPLFFLTLRLVA
jgi:molybdopterin converting factor small subunit